MSAINICAEDLNRRFIENSEDFDALNALKCSRQLTSARRSAEMRVARRPNELRDRYDADGNVAHVQDVQRRRRQVRTPISAA